MWYMDSTSITMDSLVYFMDGSGPAEGAEEVIAGASFSGLIYTEADLGAPIYTSANLKGRFKC